MNSVSKIFINTDFLSTNILPYLLKRHNFRISTNKFVKSRLYGYTCGLCHCKYSAMCAVVMRGYVHNRSLPAQRFFSAKVKAGPLPVQKANPMNFWSGDVAGCVSDTDAHGTLDTPGLWTPFTWGNLVAALSLYILSYLYMLFPICYSAEQAKNQSKCESVTGAAKL